MRANAEDAVGRARQAELWQALKGAPLFASVERALARTEQMTALQGRCCDR